MSIAMTAFGIDGENEEVLPEEEGTGTPDRPAEEGGKVSEAHAAGDERPDAVSPEEVVHAAAPDEAEAAAEVSTEAAPVSTSVESVAAVPSVEGAAAAEVAAVDAAKAALD